MTAYLRSSAQRAHGLSTDTTDDAMVFEKRTFLPPDDVLAAATRFFAQRNPAFSAFPEKAGPGWAVFRGQGGEEIALSAVGDGGITRVRGSSMLFDQLVDRFLSTLPETDGVPV